MTPPTVQWKGWTDAIPSIATIGTFVALGPVGAGYGMGARIIYALLAGGIADKLVDGPATRAIDEMTAQQAASTSAHELSGPATQTALPHST